MFSPEDREEDVLWLIKPSLHQLHFACGEGELRPGSSGWVNVDTEAIDFLTVWSGTGKGNEQTASGVR